MEMAGQKKKKKNETTKHHQFIVCHLLTPICALHRKTFGATPRASINNKLPIIIIPKS